MSLKKRIFIILGAAVVVMILITYIILRPNYSIIELHSKTFNESIYIKKVTYFAMAEFNVSISSTKELSTNPNILNDIVFAGDQLYFKFNNDTLNIYTTRQKEVPENFKSNITIIQHELTFEELKELEIEYEKGVRLFY